MSIDVRFQTHHGVRSLSGVLTLVAPLLAHPVAARAPGISVQVARDVMTDGDKRRVPVHVMIPARNLTVVPEGDVFTGGFSVYVCTAGGKTEPSGVNRQSNGIRWPPSTIGQMIFAIEFVLEKGRDQISVGVLDHRPQATGFSKMAM